MSRTTTLVLFALIGILVVLWAVFFEGEDVLDPGGAKPRTLKVCPAFLAAEVSSITLSDGGAKVYSQPVQFSRDENGWWVTCKSLQGGRRLRARGSVVELILEGMQGLTAFRVVDRPVPGDLGRFGLDESSRMSITAYRDGAGPVTIHVGSDLAPAGLLVKRGDSADVYEVDAGMRVELFPRIGSFWDHRLIPLTTLATTRIKVTPDTGDPLELVWQFSMWRLRLPTEGRADRQKCDVFRNNLMNIKIEGYADRSRLTAYELRPRFTVEIETKDPDRSIEIRFCRAKGGSMIVTIPTEKDPVLINAGILSYLRQTASDYRDRQINPITTRIVTGVKVSRGADDFLEIVREGSRLMIQGPRRKAAGLPLLELDQEKWSSFYRRLNLLEALRFEEGERKFKPAIRLLVEQDKTTREILFGPALDNGECPVVVVGEAGFGWMRFKDLDFLRESWLTLAENRAGEMLSWFNVARIRLVHADGRKALLTLGSAGQQPHLFLGNETGGKEVPQEIATRVLDKIGNFTIENWVGESVPTATTGLDAPMFTVAWQVSRKASPRSIPLEGSWQTLKIGSNLDPETIYGSISTDPALIFGEKLESLMPFLILLKWASK